MAGFERKGQNHGFSLSCWCRRAELLAVRLVVGCWLVGLDSVRNDGARARQGKLARERSWLGCGRDGTGLISFSCLLGRVEELLGSYYMVRDGWAMERKLGGFLFCVLSYRCCFCLSGWVLLSACLSVCLSALLAIIPWPVVLLRGKSWIGSECFELDGVLVFWSWVS